MIDEAEKEQAIEQARHGDSTSLIDYCEKLWDERNKLIQDFALMGKRFAHVRREVSAAFVDATTRIDLAFKEQNPPPSWLSNRPLEQTL